MKCDSCGREIKSDEKFYEIEDEFYCDDCIEEQTITFYQIKDGDAPFHEDEVGCYRSVDGYMDYLNAQIKMYQEDLEYYSKRSDDCSGRRTQNLKMKIQKLEERKREVLGGDEE